MQQPSAAGNVIGGLIGALAALIGIWLGSTVAQMTMGGEHAEAPAGIHAEH